ncbi:MAG: hypothetical protein GY915_09610 [bacterium]|nr:hypothetical protein [bacterium]
MKKTLYTLVFALCISLVGKEGYSSTNIYDVLKDVDENGKFLPSTTQLPKMEPESSNLGQL